MKRVYAEVKNRLSHGEPVDMKILMTYNDQGQTLLHLACQKRDFEFVRLLVQTGVDINAIDNYGITPIFVAVGFEFAEIVEFLIKQKQIDLNLATKKGATVLHTAVILDDYTILMMLLNSDKIGYLEPCANFDCMSVGDSKNFKELKLTPMDRAANIGCSINFCIFVGHMLKVYIKNITSAGFDDRERKIFGLVFNEWVLKELEKIKEIPEFQISNPIFHKSNPIFNLSEYLIWIIQEQNFDNKDRILHTIISLNEQVFQFKKALDCPSYESYTGVLPKIPQVETLIERDHLVQGTQLQAIVQAVLQQRPQQIPTTLKKIASQRRLQAQTTVQEKSLQEKPAKKRFTEISLMEQPSSQSPKEEKLQEHVLPRQVEIQQSLIQHQSQEHKVSKMESTLMCCTVLAPRISIRKQKSKKKWGDRVFDYEELSDKRIQKLRELEIRREREKKVSHHCLI
ncbi:MAG: ankyrin repeat domain-containing protein [Rickettsiales bacterium]|nr:ankyrin repeat domain-containing protein [Rickettsiales bacterium]